MELIAPATPVIETVRRSILTLAAVAAVGLALAGVLATVQARRLTRPIEELARAAHRLGGGDFSARPPRSGIPELDALAETLDSSRERIAALVDAERQFAANASHQLRSALTGLTLRLEELAASPDPGTRAEADEALAQAARLDATIDELPSAWPARAAPGNGGPSTSGAWSASTSVTGNPGSGGSSAASRCAPRVRCPSRPPPAPSGRSWTSC